MKNNRLTQNPGLKLAALVFAVLLWLIVVNIDDPVDSESFRNIPVTVVNEEVVTNQGKIYQIVEDTRMVTVTVHAKRSVLSAISPDNIIATADLSQMEVNTLLVPVSVTVRGYESIVSVETSPTNFQVKIEDVTRNTFPISASVSGTPRDGYVVGEISTNPERITVRGSESMVGNINRIVARVDVSGLSKDSVLDAQLVYYDGNGNVMDPNQFKNNLGDAGVSVNVQMLRIKEVGLSVKPSGTPMEGYLYTGWTTEPQSIRVCGTEEKLAELSVIEIPESQINIEGKDRNTTFTIDIAPYLPEGIRLEDESANNVVVNVEIEQEGARTFELPVEAVRVDNLSEDLSISFQTETAELRFTFTGLEELLEKLEIKNAAYIDLKTYTAPGIYEVPVKLEAVPEGVTLKENPRITILLVKKEETEEGGETGQEQAEEE